MKLSSTVQHLQHSPIRKFWKDARNAVKAGKKVYRLNIGQPDIETPACFMEAVKAFDEKVLAYAESDGLDELHYAIIDFYKNNYNVDYTKLDLLVTNGGSEALQMVFTSILEPGDEVLIAEPFYTNYNTFITAVGGKVKPIPTSAEENFHFADRKKIEAQITDKTKAIVCITPGNPTGAVLNLDEMRLIAEIAKEHDLWIISDEVYREFVFDGLKPVTFGMVDDIEDRLIVIDSVSKRYSATGARIGSILCHNHDLIDVCLKLAQGRLSSPTLDQIGAAALYRMPMSFVEGIRDEFEKRRNVVYEEMMKIPGVICQKPQGAFYMTVKIPVDDAENFLRFLLNEFDDKGETVMFAPAEGFYATPGVGKDEFRVAYVLNCDDLRRGVELIRLGLEAYNNR